ncbi:hypothetical protein ERY430_60267 [Erythrobacter sp. EC-HK427]|nr:hypothetical protein ERY430_60267 [Erythrobacter sp. EC-HK427]
MPQPGRLGTKPSIEGLPDGGPLRIRASVPDEIRLARNEIYWEGRPLTGNRAERGEPFCFGVLAIGPEFLGSFALVVGTWTHRISVFA